MKIRKDTAVEKPISTGSSIADKKLIFKINGKIFYPKRY